MMKSQNYVQKCQKAIKHTTVNKDNKGNAKQTANIQRLKGTRRRGKV